jgi:hypothetical protein
MTPGVALTLSRGNIMAEAQLERPSCPKCQAQMMLAQIMPAYLGIERVRLSAGRATTSSITWARMTIQCS